LRFYKENEESGAGYVAFNFVTGDWGIFPDSSNKDTGEGIQMSEIDSIYYYHVDEEIANWLDENLEAADYDVLDY
jgi:hypothetical protein